MEDKILTKDGIKSIDELEKAEFEQVKQTKIQNVENNFVQKESKYPPLSQPVTNQIKEFNNNPNTKKLGVIAIKKGTYLGIWIFIGLVFLILTIGMIWFNVSFTKKDFTTNVPITNNMPEIPINIENNNTNNFENINQNNYTIINQIEIGNEMAEIIADKVLEIINNTNSS